MQVVDKLWGREIWLANDEYCGKILELLPGYSSSVHHHKNKKETFYCLEGNVFLTVEDRVRQIDNTSEPVTILPKQKHSFRAKTPSRILEISTHHDDGDTYRFQKSYKIETFCFDIDGVLFTNENGDYTKAQPKKEAIEKVNKLYGEGHKIILHTARGTTTGIDWRDRTARQLWDWGVNYDELIMGKPEADVFIDDKAINVKDWV